jgi:hypothetical protein
MPSPLAEAAKAIRADIKAAVAAGTLPGRPDGITFSVRTERASLMTAINVGVLAVPDSWMRTGDAGSRRPSAEWQALESALKDIARRHYQADGQGRFISVYADADTRIADSAAA